MIFTFFIIFFFSISMAAQDEATLNLELFLHLQSLDSIDEDQTIDYVLKGDPNWVQQYLNGNELVTLKYQVDSLFALRSSIAEVRKWLQQPKSIRIESYFDKGQLLTYPEDTCMLNNNNAIGIHDGQQFVVPLDGSDVLLGIIDDGFDWQHPDFLNADSSTRFMYLWDQSSQELSYAETFFGYGAEWSKQQIDQYLITHTPKNHGSHVLGTAAGNGRASNKFKGLAPGSNIGAVSVRLSNFQASFVDAVHYLFRLADSLSMPCVINSSVGVYTGGHDGLDLYTELIDQMIEEKPGRMLVQAAGNERETAFHVHTDIQQNLSRVQFKRHSLFGTTHFYLYADTLDLSALNFSMELIDPVTQQVLLQTSPFNIKNDFQFTSGIAQYTPFVMNESSGAPVYLYVYAEQYGDSYKLYFTIPSSSDLGNWQLVSSGTGRFDIWSESNLTRTSNILKSAQQPYYQQPDSIQSIVGFWNCSEKVISVGSYQNRNYHIRYGGDTISLFTTGFPKYGISHFSSLGPSRKGYTKPDITAPGGQVLSAYSLSSIQYFRSINDFKLNEDGWHVTSRGTSMSAPMVAGALALYLECKPYASWTDIRSALLNGTRLDPNVFAQAPFSPNDHWGFGKLDVKQLLQSCIVYGCTDTSALNFNPFATISDSSCQYVSSIKESINDGLITFSPNPSNGIVQFQYSSFDPVSNQFLRCYDVWGRLLFEQKLMHSSGVIDLSAYPSGMYFIHHTDTDRIKQVTKLIKY